MDLNKPSFFRKGDLTPCSAATRKRPPAGNPDGSFYIDIAGYRTTALALTMTQRSQTFELAKGLMAALGYQLEVGNGPQQ